MTPMACHCWARLGFNPAPKRTHTHAHTYVYTHSHMGAHAMHLHAALPVLLLGSPARRLVQSLDEDGLDSSGREEDVRRRRAIDAIVSRLQRDFPSRIKVLQFAQLKPNSRAHVSVCVCVCLRVCVCLCLRVFACVCVCLRVFACAVFLLFSTHARTHFCFLPLPFFLFPQFWLLA